MSIIPLITTALKGFALFWAFVTMAVSAAFIAKCNEIFSSSQIANSNLAGGSALIAASVLIMLYFVAVFSVATKYPDHIFISVMVDTIIIGSFFIFFLGATAGLSRLASLFRYYDDNYTFASLGSASIGLGWVMTWLLFGILLFEVIYTLIHYGGAYSTWRTPFNRLVEYGATTHHTTGAGARVQGDVPMGTVGGGAVSGPAAGAGVHGAGTGAGIAPGVHATPVGAGAGVPAAEHNCQPSPAQPGQAPVAAGKGVQV
ncbi:hypothetical protein IAT38_006074 [Cryptococcus sp. DSM 104549]